MGGVRPTVLVLHGPSLDLLGIREPELYGRGTLEELDANLLRLGSELGVDVQTAQSAHEGELIERVLALRGSAFSAPTGLVLNPAGYTHTSVALHDAIRAVSIPTVEVHLSNLYARESFRHGSLTGAACIGVIMGLGAESYALALRFLAARLRGP